MRLGCAGCAVSIAVGVLVLALLLVLGWLTGSGEERIEQLSRAQEIRSVSTALDAGSEPAEVEPSEVEIAEPGRIILDVTRGLFSIRPGPPGEAIRLEGQYDAGSYRLDESYESYGEVGWIYRVEFHQRGIGLRPFVQHGPPKNQLSLVVPRDTPIVLEGRIGIGESDLELGGLWLVEVDLEVGIGQHELSFDEPPVWPMRRFRLDGSVGELRIGSLGNASPASVEVSRSIGELMLDLSGQWRRDADVKVRCGIGECRMRVPEDVGIEVRHARVTIGDTHVPALADRRPARAGMPVLTLAVKGSIGELVIDH